MLSAMLFVDAPVGKGVGARVPPQPSPEPVDTCVAGKQEPGEGAKDSNPVKFKQNDQGVDTDDAIPTSKCVSTVE